MACVCPRCYIQPLSTEVNEATATKVVMAGGIFACFCCSPKSILELLHLKKKINFLKNELEGGKMIREGVTTEK